MTAEGAAVAVVVAATSPVSATLSVSATVVGAVGLSMR